MTRSLLFLLASFLGVSPPHHATGHETSSSAAPSSASEVTASQERERVIRYSVEVAANRTEVWRAWTTNEGIREWFAPGSNVELRTFGPYEIFFSPDAEPGQRGAEDNLVLARQAEEMLSFTWNVPPTLAQVRDQRTCVLLYFEDTPEGGTRVRLRHSGWGNGGEWDEAFEYFLRAWGRVLGRLHYRFAHGPVSWDHPPTAEEILQIDPSS